MCPPCKKVKLRGYRNHKELSVWNWMVYFLWTRAWRWNVLTCEYSCQKKTKLPQSLPWGYFGFQSSHEKQTHNARVDGEVRKLLNPASCCHKHRTGKCLWHFDHISAWWDQIGADFTNKVRTLGWSSCFQSVGVMPAFAETPDIWYTMAGMTSNKHTAYLSKWAIVTPTPTNYQCRYSSSEATCYNWGKYRIVLNKHCFESISPLHKIMIFHINYLNE